MRIAYISHEYPPDTGKGGIGTYTLQMASIMHKQGHDVHVFTASYDRDINEKFENISTHRVRIKEIKDFPNKILPRFKHEQDIKAFDIIECPEIGGEVSVIKQRYPEIPLIVRLHTPAVLVTRLQNTYVPLLKKIRFVLGGIIRGRFDLGYWSQHDKNKHKDPDYLVTTQASLITAPSKAMKDWAVHFWGIEEKKIKVIPNPYEPSAAMLNIEHTETYKTITFLGRLNVLKGLVALSLAVPKVLKKHPDWKFRFIGHNESSPINGLSMKAWMQQHLKGLSSQIEFIDWVDYKELPEYLQKTDIMVIPSLFESFSYVCAEAMSAGCAVVGSKTSAMQELLDSDKYGLLINPKSSKEIAEAINKLIKNPKLRTTMGAKARQKVLKDYNAELIGKETEIIYLNVINGHFRQMSLKE